MQASSLSCHSLVGYNYRFVFTFVCDTSSVDLSLMKFNIEGDKRHFHFVPGFDCLFLNCMVHAALQGGLCAG